jgi:hypothetical protein
MEVEKKYYHNVEMTLDSSGMHASNVKKITSVIGAIHARMKKV